MESKIKVAAVSYLNTKPLVYAFDQGEMSDALEMMYDYPSKIASMLINNQVDIGLVPVATIPHLNEYHIISDFCIGATHPVKSVCLFSHVPISEITSIVLDYQSRTSNALLQILLKEYWKINPVLVKGNEIGQTPIAGETAGLIIGDRALIALPHFEYIYDLAADWQELTSLPFVFAAWIANKSLPTAFLETFNQTIKSSLTHMDVVIAKTAFEHYDLNVYYKENISYILTDEMKAGLQLFLEKLELYNI